MAENPDGDHELPRLPPVGPTEGMPAGPRFLGQWAPLVGIGGGVVLYALAFGGSLLFGGGTSDGTWFLIWLALALLLTVVLLTAGIVLVVLPRTRAFGAGVLISVGIGVIVGNGVCIALLQVS